MIKGTSPAFKPVETNSINGGSEFDESSLFESEMYCRPEGLCEVTPGVKQWVCHAFPSHTSTTQTQRPENTEKGLYQHPQIYRGLQTLSPPEKQWKKEETVVNSGSSSSRVLQRPKEAAAQKQMFWPRWHEETRSKTSKLKLLLSLEIRAQ